MKETTQTIPPFGSQQRIDWENLRYHERVAELLRAEPERVLAQARANLQRWLTAYQPGEAAARCLIEWEALLNHSTTASLIALLTEDSDEGQRLRSSTPFIGVLSPSEWWEHEATDKQKAVA